MKIESSNISIDKLKGVLITRTAIKALVDEDIVEKIISFQYKDARDMFHKYNEVEISGFGKFLVSNRKLKKKKEKIENVIIGFERKVKAMDPEKEPARIEYWERKIEKLYSLLKELNQREKDYEDKH